MSIDDIPIFQAALIEDNGLRDRVRGAIESMTAEYEEPLTAAASLDWTEVRALAGEVGVELDAAELHAAVFAGDAEWSREDLVAVIGAADSDVEGYAFNFSTPATTAFSRFGGFLNPSVGVGEDTLIGGRADTIHGVASIQGGLGDDTIHG